MLKSRQFPTRAHYEIASKIDDADPSRHMWEKFDAFATVTAAALRQAVHKARTFGEQDDAIEDEYLHAIKRFKNPACFSEAFGMLTCAMEDRRTDWLGQIFGAAELASKWHGQFFTPMEISEMIARMTISERRPGETRMTISEPACGSGGMVIAIQKVLHENGFFPWHYWVEAQDVSPLCARMAYIQLTLCGVPGRVIVGNSLTTEIQDVWPTIVGFMHPYRVRSEPESDQSDEPDPPGVPVGQQFTLEL